MKCKYCGAELPDGALTCYTCGKEVEKMLSGENTVEGRTSVVRFCTKCGKELAEKGSFCSRCGTPIAMMSLAAEAAPDEQGETEQPLQVPADRNAAGTVPQEQETDYVDAPENKTCECVYICPQCRRTIYADDMTARSLTCYQCGIVPIFSGKTAEEWETMTDSERISVFNALSYKQNPKIENAQSQGEKYSRRQEHYDDSADLGSGWVRFLRGLAYLFLIGGIIGSFIWAYNAFEYIYDDGGWFLIGLVCSIAILIVTAEIMVVLDIASDVRAIKHEIRKRK